MSSRSSLDLTTRTVKIYSGAADAQARADIAEHLADLANPHHVTAAQVGLGNANDTSDAAKPVSDATAAALALKAPLLSPGLQGIPTAPTAPVGTVSGQLATTQFVQAALNALDIDDTTDDLLVAHLANNANPHQVTADQVGLGNVDDTADLDKPVSSATQTALNTVSASVVAVAGDLDLHVADTNNPHGVTAVDVGLGNADDTADLDKPVSGPQQTAINVASAAAAAAQADIDAHEASTSNPHSVTKAQVGLGSADNTADLAKPISTATQAAINAVSASVVTVAGDIDLHEANVSNPHGVTKAQIGLGSVDNTADLAKPISAATQIAINAAVAGTGTVATDLAAHVANTSNPHAVDKADVGLGSADNTADLAKPVSAAQQTAINAAAAIGTAAQADIDGHQANVSNPHAVSKSQVGLGNVDNTADAAKPVSAPQQTALNLKANIASPALTGTPTAPTAAPGTDSPQIATTAYADAAAGLAADAAAGAADDAADAIAATAPVPSLVAGVPFRPGDAIGLYGETKTGAPATVTLLDPTWAVNSAAGRVARVVSAGADDPQTVTPAAAYPVEPGRIYEVRWRVQRIANPADPLNDAVSLGLAWLTNTKAANGAATVVENIPLVVADGIVERTVRVGITPPLGFPLDFTAPANTIYFRPYIDIYGDAAAISDAVTIDVQDITAAATGGKLPVRIVTPANGATVTLTDLRPLYINNAAELAALAIRMPASAGSGDLAELGFRSVVTALAIQTNGGAPIAGSATSAYGPGAAIQMRYIDSTIGWVPWK